MNAAASRVETKVIAEDRIARIESDVAEIKDDVKTVNIRLNDSIAANAREFGALRAELAMQRADTEKSFGVIRADTEKRFGALQAAIESNKTETEKGFGALRVEIAGNKVEAQKSFGALQVSIESNKTEAEKNFASLRVEVEKIRTTIESAKFWIVGTGIGIAAALLGILHTLKVI